MRPLIDLDAGRVGCRQGAADYAGWELELPAGMTRPTALLRARSGSGWQPDKRTAGGVGWRRGRTAAGNGACSLIGSGNLGTRGRENQTVFHSAVATGRK
jgi:hypothetical protein